MKIHFFGVGTALNENMDNTYFLIEDGNDKIQIDCGGGLGLAQKVFRGDVIFNNLFITHKHIDHYLGLFHLVRIFNKFNYGNINIYCSKDVYETTKVISSKLESNSLLLDNGKINFIFLNDNEKINIDGFDLIPLNLNSKKIEQYGFLLEKNGKKILFFGDEAIGVLNRKDLEKITGIDYLICESNTTDDNYIKGIHNPFKVSHITAKLAGEIANKLNAKNLILVHTKEKLGGNRQQLLKNDAKKAFNGNIKVPNEGNIIEVE